MEKIIFKYQVKGIKVVIGKIFVKTVNVKFVLEQAMKIYKGSRGIALPFL
jgi:hypothetical protein